MKIIIKLFFLISLVSYSISCKKPEDSSSCDEDLGIYAPENYKELNNDNARLFKLYQNKIDKSFKIKVLNPQTNKVYSNYIIDSYNLANSIIVLNESQLKFFFQLNASNVISGITSYNAIKSQKVIDTLKARSVKEYGAIGLINIDQLKGNSSNWVVLNGGGEAKKQIKPLLKSGKEFFYSMELEEKDSIASAEWIKVYGVLIGKYDLAVEVFDRYKSF